MQDLPQVSEAPLLDALCMPPLHYFLMWCASPVFGPPSPSRSDGVQAFLPFFFRIQLFKLPSFRKQVRSIGYSLTNHTVSFFGATTSQTFPG